MAVHIRLRRMGKTKRPFYRIVAADSRRARDGRFLEILGTYDPIPTPAVVMVKEEKLAKWLDEGATPSETVSSLLTQIGFLEKYEKAKKGLDVSELTLKTTITERHKKTRKLKKATIASEEAETEAVPAQPAAEAAEAGGEDKEAPAEEAPAETAAEAPPDEQKE